MKSSTHLVAVGLVATLFVLRLAYALGMDIHPDEAYYWTWSRMLDWSYNDQGPGIALYTLLFTSILGDSIFAVKLAASLAAAGSILLVYLAALELGLSGVRLWLSLAIMALLPGFFGGALLLLHDSALILAWTAALYCILRYIRRRELTFFYLIFLFMGLGVLAKYTMVFFALSIVIWFFVEKSARPLIRSPHFWVAAALGALLAAPLLIWNLQHDWEGVGAVMNLRSSNENADEATTGLYLIGQVLSFSPLWLLLFWIVVVVGAVRWSLVAGKRLASEGPANWLRRLGESFNAHEFFRAPEEPDEATREFLRNRAAYRFVLIQSLLLPLYFLYFSYEKTVQPNWVFPAYPAMALVIAANRISFPSNWTRRLYDGIFALGLVLVLCLDLFILLSAQLTAFLPGAVEPFWIPGNRVRGFRQAIEIVARERDRVDPGALIASNRYQDSAVASWYLPGQPHVPSINILQKNQYSFWPGLQKGENYVVFAIQENTCEKAALFWVPVLDYMFDEVRGLGEFDVVMDGAAVKRVNMFYGKNYQRNWDRMLVEYLNEKIILDFMPNLKGKFVGLASKKGQANISKAMGKMYLDKKGRTQSECTVF